MDEKLNDLEHKKEQMPYLAPYMTENTEGMVQVNIRLINDRVKSLESDLFEIREWYKNIICKQCIHPEKPCICPEAGKKMPYRIMRGE